MTSSVDVWLVFLVALGTALATGLGALPLLLLRDATAATLGTANAIAGGLMLAATQLLFVEGVELDVSRTVVGAMGGILAIAAIARWIHHGDDKPLAIHLRGAGTRAALLIVAVMTAHSAAEGIGVGVSFGGGEELGLLVAIAIAVHNIPEGLAISLTMVPNGSSIRAAAGWSIFSSLPQPLLAVPAFLFVEAFAGVLPIGLGVAGGAMLWMVLRELLPEAIGRAGVPRTCAGLVGGYLAMLAFTQLLG